MIGPQLEHQTVHILCQNYHAVVVRRQKSVFHLNNKTSFHFRFLFHNCGYFNLEQPDFSAVLLIVAYGCYFINIRLRSFYIATFFVSQQFLNIKDTHTHTHTNNLICFKLYQNRIANQFTTTNYFINIRLRSFYIASFVAYNSFKY